MCVSTFVCVLLLFKWKDIRFQTFLTQNHFPICLTILSQLKPFVEIAYNCKSMSLFMLSIVSNYHILRWNRITGFSMNVILSLTIDIVINANKKILIWNIGFLINIANSSATLTNISFNDIQLFPVNHNDWKYIILYLINNLLAVFRFTL